MIVYKTSADKWRLPRSIYRKNTSTNQFVPSQNVRKKDGTIAWHRNQLNAYSGTPTAHPYWQYSMNPSFAVSEENYINGLNAPLEICFDTGLSNPSSNGRYQASSLTNSCAIYSTQSQSNGLADCILKPKFSLNVAGGSKYRSQVTVTNRYPNGPKNARYFLFWATAIRGGGGDTYVQLSEFVFFGANSVALTNANVPGIQYYNYNGEVSPANEGPNNLWDQNVNTKWLSFTGANSTVLIDFGTNIDIHGYRMSLANDAPHRDPVNWGVYWWDGANWQTISTIIGYQSSTTSPPARYTTYSDFNINPTILTGFWTNTDQDTADFFQSGFATDWSPPVSYGRTANLSDTRSPPQSPLVWNKDTKILTWDITVNASHSWARPIIKIESTATNALPMSYTIDEWWIYRIS